MTVALCYPHPSEDGPLARPAASDLHETAGLPGNWALDFLAPGGSRIVVTELCRVTKLSGHDPAIGVLEGDVFGWSVYYRAIHSPHGFYYLTHMGNRNVYVGQWLEVGAIIGHVGHWPGDPGRSHSHLGFTADTGGEAASKAHIVSVSEARRIPGHWPPA